MDFDLLKEKFQEDVQLSDEMIDKQIISLPGVMSKYVNAYNTTLSELDDISIQKDELFYSFMMEYRGGKSDLSHFTWSATELKKMIETSPRFLELTKKELQYSTQLKVIEEMMGTIKGMGYSINNYIAYKKLIHGN
jgi:hypothetical protein